MVMNADRIFPPRDSFFFSRWVSIAGGAHLTIGSREECRDVPSLGGSDGLWAQRGVTLVNAVPTLINIMTSLDDQCGLPPKVRLLNLGGEACPPALVNRLWHSNLQIINTYGPSETTVTATFQELFPNETVTIGKPLPSYHALILPIADDHEGPGSPPTAPLPIEEGIEGELAIGGSCLGNGYVGRPELTAEKFIRHPFGSKEERLYRTGDRVRLDAKHNLIFLGRIDTQVKHRGFRIELGEIECALSSHQNVQTVSVILSSVKSRLEAYIVNKADKSIDIQELRSTLTALPAYMQPEAYFFLKPEEMPRLPSGKINAKALQDVSKRMAEIEAESKQVAASEALSQQPDIDPSSDLGILLNFMRTVFPQAPAVLPSSDFFDDLGGHSLAAAMLVSKLRKECPEDCPLRGMGLQDIYVCRTPESMVSKYSISSSSSEDIEADLEEKEDPIAYNAGGPTGVLTGEIWPVSQTRFVLCGLAQIPALIFLWFLQSLQFLVPYLVFIALHDSLNDIGFAILATYGAFVFTPFFLFAVAMIGKWIIIGRTKPGEYPLYGQYYFRWWFVSHLVAMVDLAVIAETPLIGFFWSALGARLGVHVSIGQVLVNCLDLIEIGDDVVLANGVNLTPAVAERGRLILKPIKIGSGSRIGSNSVIEGGSVIENDVELMRVSMVPDGMRIPAGERWHGSPARFLDDTPEVGLERRTRPNFARILATGAAISFLTTFVLPIIWFAPQIPTMIFFEFVYLSDINYLWAQIAIFTIPASFAYLALVFLEMIVLRWIVLGYVKEGTYKTTSVFFVRKWFVDRLMALSLSILQPVYATLYVIPFLRALGVKMGDRAEVSTASGINFNLTEIGDESFVADNVYIGPVEVRGNSIELRKTIFSKRAFAGNSSVIPQGTVLPSETLVGVLSVAPDPDVAKPLLAGQSCFGSPPVMMPARQAANICHPPHLLYAPKASQIAMRLFIEGSRIVIPRAVIIFGIGFGCSIFRVAYKNIGVPQAALLLPFFQLFLFGIPALLVTVLSKWILIGRYKTAEWPLWSNEVWRSEFITSTYDSLAAPAFTNQLTGTPYLAMCFRLFGVKIGKRVTLLHNDITEYDMVTIGDEAIINNNAGAQTHLFEDRVMKIGPVTMEDRSVLKSYSICLPNSRISENGQVGSLSLVMKGESVPTNEAWEGAPIAPRRKRRRGLFTSAKGTDVSEKSSTASPNLSSSASSFRVETKPSIPSPAFSLTPGSSLNMNPSNLTLVEALQKSAFGRPRGDGSRASSKFTEATVTHTRQSSRDTRFGSRNGSPKRNQD